MVLPSDDIAFCGIALCGFAFGSIAFDGVLFGNAALVMLQSAKW